MSRPAGRLASWGLLATVAVLALLPRWSLSDEIDPGQRQWIGRARRFQAAVASGDWAHTYLAPHPGLTVLWIGGLAERTAGASSFEKRTVVAARAVAATSALLLALSLATLKRILERLEQPAPLATTLVAGGLLAFDPPLVLANGLLSLDGMLALFALLSGLLIILHGITRTRSSLAGALVAGGLAAATKVAGLALLLAPSVTRVGPAGRAGRPSWRRVAAVTAGWLGAIAVTVALLLPAMWVEPRQTLDRLLLGGDQEHESLAVVLTQPREAFLAGRGGAARDLLFYVVNLAYRATPLAVAGALGGLALAGYRKSRLARQVALLLLLFLVALTLARQKEARYLLPAYPLLDVLGALGLMEAGRRLAARFGRPALAAAAPLALVALQSLWVVAAHPYYELRLDPLLGGARVGARVLRLEWTAGYREAVAALKRQAERSARPLTWSGGTFKWKYYLPPRRAEAPLRWLGRAPEDEVADCHVYDLLDVVADPTPVDVAWRSRGVVVERIRHLGIDVLELRCLERPAASLAPSIPRLRPSPIEQRSTRETT